jgi:predicted kinase
MFSPVKVAYIKLNTVLGVMLIIICGLPGSGKSSLARKLRSRLPAAYLNSDVVRKQIFPKPQYTENEKKDVYNDIVNQAEKMLHQGKNVIVDATFYTRKYRQMMIDTAESAGSEHCIIMCTLPEETVKARLEKRMERGKNPSDADYKVYLEMKNKFEDIEGDFLRMDCSKPIGAQVQKATRYIGEKRGRRKNK